MAFIKNLFAACCTAAALVILGQSAWSQSARTIHLIVPVPPGASTDAVARLMAEQIGRAQARSDEWSGPIAATRFGRTAPAQRRRNMRRTNS